MDGNDDPPTKRGREVKRGGNEKSGRGKEGEREI